MTSAATIRKWFEQEKDKGHDRMIVVCDTFDHEDYPVGCSAADVEEKLLYYKEADMQRVMEVYNLNKPMEEQFMVHRVWNA